MSKGGGSSYPNMERLVPEDIDLLTNYQGDREVVSLVDWFAGQAIMGIYANAERYKAMEGIDWEDAASNAYSMARAMMAERSKSK